jgi:hypothetical protein
MDAQDFRKMAEVLPWRLAELDGQPRIANPAEVPKNAPKDQPQAIFSSADGRIVLEVAPLKLQFRMLPGEVVETGGPQKGLKPYGVSEAFAAFLPLATKVHNVFSEHFGATANRVGVFAEMFGALGGSANQRMQRGLLANNNHFGERLIELNIQALSKPALDNGRVVNRWIRVKPLRSNDERRADLAMGVEIDINTLLEDSYDMTGADVEQFIQAVQRHIETQIPLLQDASFFDN